MLYVCTLDHPVQKIHTEAIKEATHYVYVFTLNHPVYAYPNISV